MAFSPFLWATVFFAVDGLMYINLLEERKRKEKVSHTLSRYTRVT
jgi:hypothetical protein